MSRRLVLVALCPLVLRGECWNVVLGNTDWEGCDAFCVPCWLLACLRILGERVLERRWSYCGNRMGLLMPVGFRWGGNKKLVYMFEDRI